MKLVSFYTIDGVPRLGLLNRDRVYDLHDINPHIPDSMEAFLELGAKGMDLARLTERAIQEGCFHEMGLKDPPLAAPVPNPRSLRDAYAFRQHVVTSRLNRGLDMIPEFDQFPVFYFSNHLAVQGPGNIMCMPDHFNQLDFELEIAIVLNKAGRNIKAEDADTYIAGYMIMNDFSSRALQMQEMKLNLGPAKGKDFATAFGPWLVTPDELESQRLFRGNAHVGASYDLEMSCTVNDQQVSHGNASEMNWTFAEIIERVSYGVDLRPGEIIGSGTVGTGCFLELNGTGNREYDGYPEQWLKPHDIIELKIEGLGVLRNNLLMYETDQSILTRKN